MSGEQSVEYSRHRVFPFAAIVGQESMKLALMLNAVNPKIGGVLIRGEKGTAKSTAVRGLARLLPRIDTVSGCQCRCDPSGDSLCPSCTQRIAADAATEIRNMPAPMVDLPLGATEDMVLGSIDFEAAVKTGVSQAVPGLLARANRGVLYVDEVNLLDDHLVDAVLDAAESGVNLIEREGISAWNPARFILIGTMNPEEGELRPQILDRFGLAVRIEAEMEPARRVDLLKSREEFDLHPEDFEKRVAREQGRIRESLAAARTLLASVFVPNHLRTFIAEICAQNNVAGHRADLVIERAACAHAALAGRNEVSSDDIIAVAPMALLHRMRGTEEPRTPPPPPSPPSPNDENDEDERNDDSDQEEPPQQAEAMQPPENGKQEQQTSTDEDDSREVEPDQPPQEDENSHSEEEVQEIGEPFKVRKLTVEKDGKLRSGSGRRSRTRSATRQGRYVKSTPHRGKNDLALDATLRAAAPFQLQRRMRPTSKHLAVLIEESDIREKIRERRVGNVLIFLVDGSGSMGAQRRMVETKAAIMSLLLDAYQKRDKVCMIVFRGNEAQVVLPPTGSVEMAGKLLADLPIGGRTPLSAGLSETSAMLTRILRKTPTARPLVLVVTDGKANASLGEAPPHREAVAIAAQLKERFEDVRFAVIDTEPPGVVRFYLARQLADVLHAEYFHPETLRAEELIKIARSE